MSSLLKTAVLVVTLMGGAAGAQAPTPTTLTPEQRAQVEQWWESQPKLNLPFDNNGAKVLIVEFTDLQCPHCRQKYLEIQPILDKYAARPKDVTFLLKHWPVSSTCNPRISSNVHPAACDAAAAVVMARPKGTADKLSDWFFLHQAEMTPATVRSAAADIGKITAFDALYPRAIQEVKTDVALGSGIGVDGTPAFFINARRLPGGGVAAPYFEALIELELRRPK